MFIFITFGIQQPLQSTQSAPLLNIFFQLKTLNIIIISILITQFWINDSKTSSRFVLALHAQLVHLHADLILGISFCTNKAKFL